MSGWVTITWLLQISAVIIGALTTVFTIVMLLSMDQSPSTIESLNWAWIEDAQLNNLDGFQEWCSYQFEDVDCTDSTLSFKADIEVGLRGGLVTVWIWDATKSVRRADHVAVALFNSDTKDNECPLPSGLCSYCDRSSVGAVVMLIFVVLICSGLFVEDVVSLSKLYSVGWKFTPIISMMHFIGIILVAIALGLMMDNCLEDEKTGLQMNLGPMFLLGIFSILCMVIQLAIQAAFYMLWRESMIKSMHMRRSLSQATSVQPAR